jgi:hypothetical protein
MTSGNLSNSRDGVLPLLMTTTAGVYHAKQPGVNVVHVFMLNVLGTGLVLVMTEEAVTHPNSTKENERIPYTRSQHCAVQVTLDAPAGSF